MGRRQHLEKDRAGSAATGMCLALGLTLALASGTRAATYVVVSDGDLLDQATTVVEATILHRLPALRGARPATEHLAAVGRVIKGRLTSSTLIVRTPGGSTETGELVIPGSPRFAEGDRVLLFLAANPDGSYSPLHLALGVFFRRDHDTGSLAVRTLENATLLDARLDQATDLARDHDLFLEWLEDRHRGLLRPPDYLLERPVSPVFLAVPYTLMEYRGNHVRWFDFDAGDPVSWFFRSADSTDSQAEFEAALGAWKPEPARLVLAGETNRSNGFERSDGVNAIIFGDPNDSVTGSYSCDANGGGTLATGGWWASGTGEYKGETYARIVEAEIVVNDGVECLIETNRAAAAELFTHELGHTLGIGHSCGDDVTGPCGLEKDKNDATMRASLHDDGRGGAIRPDDRAALVALYGASPSPPSVGPQPSELTVKALKPSAGRLRWIDNSSTEAGFEVWRRVGSRAFELWREAPADTTSLRFSDAKPGKTYGFRVRAVLGDPADGLTTEFSNTASVTMPKTLKRPKKLKATVLGPTSGRLVWKDRSDGEKKFRIERRTGSGGWESWRSAPANATRFEFDDGEPGTTYSFRVQARRAGSHSSYSNIATVTLPE